MNATAGTASAIAADPFGVAASVWSAATAAIYEDWQAGNYGEAVGRSVTGILGAALGGKGLGALRNGVTTSCSVCFSDRGAGQNLIRDSEVDGVSSE